MKIKLILTGKTTDPHIVALFEDYVKRIKHYCSFEVQILPDLKNTKNLSIVEQKEREGEMLLKVLETSDFLLLLDEKGKLLSSVEFADFIEKKAISGTKSMIFAVGGAYGFSPTVYQRADSLLSLSPMTFSHQLVRLVFIEQLYRAHTILKGEPYHHN